MRPGEFQKLVYKNVEATYKSGCSDFVTRPINSELLSKVKSFIDA